MPVPPRLTQLLLVQIFWRAMNVCRGYPRVLRVGDRLERKHSSEMLLLGVGILASKHPGNTLVPWSVILLVGFAYT
jgi:hypothetical protein